MAQSEVTSHPATIEIRNIGGISETTVELTPGVTILAGRNATNRTSLLQALMAALGSENATIKGDAEEGFVELSVGDHTYTRRLRRQDGTVVSEGDPYLDDPTLADLFAFLLESNEARRAIARDDDLREVIMRPVDTAEIEQEIDRLTDERQRIERRREDLDSLKQQLPDLEGRCADLETDLAEKRDELADIEQEINEYDADVDEQREEKAELEEKLDELSDVRGQLETVRHELDSERESLEALRAEREELDRESEDYAEVSEDRLDGITAEVQRLRNEKNGIESTVSELQTVIQFNEDLLDGDYDLFEEFQDGDRDSDVTDQLLDDDEDLVCWTCGSDIDMDQIESMVERLRELRNAKMEERNAIEAEINDLETERIEIEERRRQRDQIRSRVERIEGEVGEREDRIEELQDRRSELTDRVEQLESTVEALRTDDQSELLDLHKEANRLEVEIERLERDLEEIKGEIDRIEGQIGKRDQLDSQRDEIQQEIEELRTRVERLERQAVKEFNEHIEAVLDILGYENLERIWIERTEREVREGRRTVTKGHFDLHVVRTTSEDTVYEDSVEHLSESEREVTGLVFGLAGYLAHEVYEELPFILLDSVEALDAERISALVEYIEDFADYLVAALLEEDAAALEDDYQRITEI